MELKSVNKKAITNMLLAAAIWCFIFIAVGILAWIVFLNLGFDFNKVFNIIYFGSIILLCGVLLIIPFIRYKRYKYQIDDIRIVKQEGIIFKTIETTPIERVHQIAIIRGPIDRLTGLAKVAVTTAGGEIIIRFLDFDEAVKLVSHFEKTIKNIIVKQGSNNEIQ